MCLGLVVFVTLEDMLIEFHMSGDESLVGCQIQQLVTSLITRVS